MIDSTQVISGGTVFAVPVVLLGGLIAGLNPCCLAMYPAAAASCCATCNTVMPARKALTHSIMFIVGAAVATSFLGVVAALFGRVLGQFGSSFRYAVAVIPLIMGLHLLGWIQLPFHRISPKVLKPGFTSAFAAGFLLSMAITPCGTPVLAAVLSYVAYKGSFAFGALLLFAYGIGAGLPVVALGTISGNLALRLNGLGWSRWVDRVSGTILIASGLYLLWLA